MKTFFALSLTLLTLAPAAFGQDVELDPDALVVPVPPDSPESVPVAMSPPEAPASAGDTESGLAELDALEASVTASSVDVASLMSRISQLETEADCGPQRMLLADAVETTERGLDNAARVLVALQDTATAVEAEIVDIARDLGTTFDIAAERDANIDAVTRPLGGELVRLRSALGKWTAYEAALRAQLRRLTGNEVLHERGCALGLDLGDLSPPPVPQDIAFGLPSGGDAGPEARAVVDALLTGAGLR